MIELTPDNAAAYLRDRGRVGDGPVRVAALGGGVSNAVLRVETPNGLFVLKQARPQLRTAEAWFSDLNRVFREQDVMRLLRPLLPPGGVPEVLFRDDANFAYLMSHAPPPARDWRSILLSGAADPARAEEAGRILGRIHEATARNRPLLEPFADATVFDQLRTDPFYRRVIERRSEVAAPVRRLIERLHSERVALCHGDFSPKNLLAHPGGFTLVDYETAHFGDPTFDLGFFLSHLLLKAAYHAPNAAPFLGLTRAFWRGYGEEVRFRPEPELVAETVGHLGGCLLARIDGTSPAPYLTDEPKREAVRRIGRRLLLEAPPRWDEVLGAVEAELR